MKKHERKSSSKHLLHSPLSFKTSNIRFSATFFHGQLAQLILLSTCCNQSCFSCFSFRLECIFDRLT